MIILITLKDDCFQVAASFCMLREPEREQKKGKRINHTESHQAHFK